ncbi:hypothetical protein F4826_005040, partial [Rahnella inusitata]|nr:hypothetical protein [Rahnella inusitata]
FQALHNSHHILSAQPLTNFDRQAFTTKIIHYKCAGK